MGRTPERCLIRYVRTDHPHACGENAIDSTASQSPGGPSPRVWGERRCGQRDRGLLRTIPTRVGRTTTMYSSTCIAPDHPHACGENHVGRRPGPAATGPSPRVWGEPALRNGDSRMRRTIPTRVGRTTNGANSQAVVSDHPHACGENFSSAICRACDFGPSPRVWGERLRAIDWHLSARTIPTRVGRTSLSD